MKKIFHKILNLPELKNDPPVLIDIGASEKIHPKWETFAKYSICLAFDADERDFRFVEKEESNFRKLYTYNSIVTDKVEDTVNFYLTKSPYCSSVLKPDQEALRAYLHSELFKVENVIELKATHLQKALNETGIKQIDWFKTDSQGIDLRLFKSLNETVQKKIIVSEFEPGIIDAYEGEDKLYSILAYFNDHNFWLSDIKIKGVPRIPSSIFNSEFKGDTFRKLLKESVKSAPGWGEMTFINSFEDNEFSMREFLLGWLFCSIENHHSFAFVIAKKGSEKYKKEIFDELKHYSKKMMRSEVYKIKFLPSVFDLIKKKFSK